jgi:two-component system nitrate/nitrite response regulator NarL
MSTRVALLEPHLLARVALSDALTHGGCTVIGAFSDSADLLALAVRDPPDVALIEPHGEAPPGGERPDAARELSEKGLGLRFVVYSGAASPAAFERWYALGAGACLDKRSADARAVLQAVGAVARGERLFPVEMMELPFQQDVRAPESVVLRGISPRERDVLVCIASGSDNLQIASRLGISKRTVKAHVSALYRKLGMENRTRLALLALQLGLKPYAAPEALPALPAPVSQAL